MFSLCLYGENLKIFYVLMVIRGNFCMTRPYLISGIVVWGWLRKCFIFLSSFPQFLLFLFPLFPFFSDTWSTPCSGTLTLAGSFCWLTAVLSKRSPITFDELDCWVTEFWGSCRPVDCTPLRATFCIGVFPVYNFFYICVDLTFLVFWHCFMMSLTYAAVFLPSQPMSQKETELVKISKSSVPSRNSL